MRRINRGPTAGRGRLLYFFGAFSRACATIS